MSLKECTSTRKFNFDSTTLEQLKEHLLHGGEIRSTTALSLVEDLEFALDICNDLTDSVIQSILEESR